MDNKNLSGKVFDIQRYTLNDGPGIRTEIFLQGCYLRCLWCHSPDSQAINGELAWFPLSCVGVEKCGTCIYACNKNALTPGEKVYSKFAKEEIALPHLDRDKCVKCGSCTKECYPKALYLTCSEMTIDELVAIIKKDKKYYESTNGGLTLSGGEPLVQAEFAAALLREAKELNIHTALDTSGCVQWESYERVLDYVDLFLFDLKCMFSKISEVLIGSANEQILENARRLATKGKKLQIRYPMIPGLNDQQENMQEMITFCLELGSAVESIQLLPYHKLGTGKYERIGKEYKIGHINPMSREQAEKYEKLFKESGFKTMIG